MATPACGQKRAHRQLQLELQLDPPPPVFLEVLILDGLKSKFTEVLIIGDFKWPRMSEMQNVQEFLEVLILKGLRLGISPP
jgi:hypothetical protein